MDFLLEQKTPSFYRQEHLQSLSPGVAEWPHLSQTNLPSSRAKPGISGFPMILSSREQQPVRSRTAAKLRACMLTPSIVEGEASLGDQEISCP